MTFSEAMNSKNASHFPHFGTDAIHVGQEPDPNTGAVIPPISLSSTFKQTAIGTHKGYEYSRSGNPTRRAFEEAMAKLENGKYCCAFGSGSATTAALASLFGQGSHVISIQDVYGGTFRYFTRVANTFGIEASFVDLEKYESLLQYIKPNTKMIWVETPTNPTLRICDIQAVAEIAKQKGLCLVVDNTFLSPYFQRPLDLGADIVMHSVTKYINGHSDVVMGVAITSNRDYFDRISFLQNAMGGVPSAFDCYLAHRGLKTLHLRMRQHEKSAFALAQMLEKHPKVTRTIYPGLPSHPQHELAKKQCKGFGGMISFDIKGNLENAEKFLQSCKIFTLAESLGGVESLCELPALMTHASVSEENRQALGISNTLIRLSVGIEETEDILEDVRQALEKATS